MSSEKGKLQSHQKLIPPALISMKLILLLAGFLW